MTDHDNAQDTSSFQQFLEQLLPDIFVTPSHDIGSTGAVEGNEFFGGVLNVNPGGIRQESEALTASTGISWDIQTTQEDNLQQDLENVSLNPEAGWLAQGEQGLMGGGGVSEPGVTWNDIVNTSNPTASSGDYQCPICNKVFTRRKRMESCLNQHSGIRPFICNGVCGNSSCRRGFTNKEELDRHQKYPKKRCEQCGEVVSSQNLARHMRRHHPNL